MPQKALAPTVRERYQFFVGRHQHDELDHGFNLSLTRDRLVAALLAELGNDVGAQPLPAEPDPTSPEVERQAALWTRAEAAGAVHGLLHGCPVEVSVNEGECQAVPRCDLERCRIAGLSFALLELCQYWGDRHRADLRICIAEIDAHLSRLDSSVAGALNRASSTLLSEMRKQKDEILAQAAAMENSGNPAGAAELRLAAANLDKLLERRRTRLIRARWLGRAVRVMTVLARALNRSIAKEMSPHRQVPAEIGAGRPKASLLTAVVQHLKRGGLERREMIELIAGIGGGAASTEPAALKEQIRQRLRGDDCRTIGPWEKSDGLRPGKGRRAVQNGPPVTDEGDR
jgi:hypothetical protein